MWLFLKRAAQKMSTTITGGALIIGTASVFSRLVGLLRDNLFAKYFGDSYILDAYNAAFKIPDLIFNILVLGALSASFIPVFLELWHKENKAQAWETANSVLNILLIGLVSLAGMAFLGAPYVSQYILMSERSIAEQELTTQLMRIMLVSIIFFGISNIFSGILNSFRKFLAYALAPIFYNFGIILGIVVLYKYYGAVGLAYGVGLGAALHFLVQLPAVLKTGWRYSFKINWHGVGVRKILKLMPARSLALGVAQLNALIIATLALRLPTGSLTLWTYADNLQQFPINVFGVSLALSAFPVFSRAFATNNHAEFKENFSLNFRKVLFFIIPVSLIILLMRAQLVRLILGSLGHGQFGWDETIITAQVLGIFSVALFAQATIPMLARSFFAQQDTKTPVIISIITVLVNAGLAWVLSGYFGLYGLALAFSLSSLLDMLLLLAALRVRFGDLEDSQIIKSVFRIILASAIMGLVIQGMKYIIAPWVDMQTFVGIFLQTIISAGAGVGIYLFLAFYFKFSEVEIICQWLQKARTQIFNGKKKS